jgi:hypothetical protein
VELQVIQLGSEPLKTFVFYFWESILVQDRNEWSVVGPDLKVFQWQTVDEGSALFCCPANGKQFQLDHCVTSFSFG